LAKLIPILQNKAEAMTKQADFANTPFYVLKSENQPVGPTIKFDDGDAICVCIYGFSDKPIYDTFIESSGQSLAPYPLVKGYLANQIAEAESADAKGAHPGLVVLDATDPKQSVLLATTMASVLLAQQDADKRVCVEFELAFDSGIPGYRIIRSFEGLPASDSQTPEVSGFEPSAT